jgi:hypothetical protein
MSKVLLTLAAAFMPVLASMSCSFDAKAAGMDVPRAGPQRIVATGPYCRALWRCGPAGCGWFRVCSSPCPDRYSCSSLYGAYGPYGGFAFWAGYSYGGWGVGYR